MKGQCSGASCPNLNPPPSPDNSCFQMITPSLFTGLWVWDSSKISVHLTVLPVLKTVSQRCLCSIWLPQCLCGSPTGPLEAGGTDAEDEEPRCWRWGVLSLGFPSMRLCRIWRLSFGLGQRPTHEIQVNVCLFLPGEQRLLFSIRPVAYLFISLLYYNLLLD